MFRRLYIFSWVLFLCLFTACEEPAPLRLNQNPAQLVVVCNFTPDRAVQAFVSKWQPILEETDVEYLRDATVEIFRGDTYLEALQLVDPKHASEIPYYTTVNLAPEANVEYTIKVSAPGYEPATAKSRIPAPTRILSAQASGFQMEDEPDNGLFIATYNLRLSFEDPGDEVNFYHISLLQQIITFQKVEGDTLITGQYLLPIMFDPQDNENFRVAHIGGGLLLSDEGFENKFIDFDIPLRIELKKNEEKLGKLFVDLRTVSEEYYRYFAALSRQRQASGSPFAEPVTLFDNIDGGQGIFAGYNSSRDSLSLQF